MRNEKAKEMFVDYPDVVDVKMLQEMLGGISKKLAYKLLQEQDIKSIRIGRKYKIPKVNVIAYLLYVEIKEIHIA